MTPPHAFPTGHPTSSTPFALTKLMSYSNFDNNFNSNLSRNNLSSFLHDSRIPFHISPFFLPLDLTTLSPNSLRLHLPPPLRRNIQPRWLLPTQHHRNWLWRQILLTRDQSHHLQEDNALYLLPRRSTRSTDTPPATGTRPTLPRWNIRWRDTVPDTHWNVNVMLSFVIKLNFA